MAQQQHQPLGSKGGPRLIGRLTAELVHRSPQFMNCVRDYEINLRGNKIAAIENLGATENQFDCIDLSDNALVRVEQFPKLPRLKVLLLCNNRITKIGRGLPESIPNLERLVLSNNRVANLQDLQPLAGLNNLRHISLLQNPVVQQQHYRLFLLHLLPSLKTIDFKKVKQQERDEAEKKYGTAAAPSTAQAAQPALEQLANGHAPPDQGQDAREDVPAAAAPAAGKLVMSEEEATALRAAIANAQTLQEVQRLEEALRTGNLPSELTRRDMEGVAAGKGPPRDGEPAENGAMEVDGGAGEAGQQEDQDMDTGAQATPGGGDEDQTMVGADAS